MQLPITEKDLDTIISALSLGGDTRLYFLLKNVRDNNNLQNDTHGNVQVYSESDEYQCQNGMCDI